MASSSSNPCTPPPPFHIRLASENLHRPVPGCNLSCYRHCRRSASPAAAAAAPAPPVLLPAAATPLWRSAVAVAPQPAAVSIIAAMLLLLQLPRLLWGLGQQLRLPRRPAVAMTASPCGCYCCCTSYCGCTSAAAATVPHAASASSSSVSGPSWAPLSLTRCCYCCSAVAAVGPEVPDVALASSSSVSACCHTLKVARLGWVEERGGLANKGSVVGLCREIA